MERLGESKNFWKTKLGIIVLLIIMTCALAAIITSILNEIETDRLNRTYMIGELAIQPNFPGGEEEFHNYIRANIDIPEHLWDTDSTLLEPGIVYVNFIINKNGKTTGAKILKGINQEVDHEILRILNTMPTWSPGKLNDTTPVKTSYTLPVQFQ